MADDACNCTNWVFKLLSETAVKPGAASDAQRLIAERGEAAVT
jgi:hypothetical protein